MRDIWNLKEQRIFWNHLSPFVFSFLLLSFYLFLYILVPKVTVPELPADFTLPPAPSHRVQGL